MENSSGAKIAGPTTATTTDKFWQAIQTRDSDYDGEFYYGVRTTGVYCRPSCASRRPKRKNVLFFALPEAARQAGFRACLRCRPDETVVCDPQAELTQSICRLIDQQLEEPVNIAALSERVKLSKFYLQRLFKKLMGITPRQYAEARRADLFKTRVKAGQSVTDALYEAGYGSSSRLYEKASAQFGMTPATYRKGGIGMKINYTITECPLGLLLVAVTDKGICSVTLGDKSKELTGELRAEFPRAEIALDEKRLQVQVRALLAYLAGQEPHPDLPLDVQGTAFQKRVWEELRRIPYGQTASYGEIARRIGRPSATRAVARACATNPAALVTPCHRIVRESGELGGYRWGVERKRQLLEKEKSTSLKRAAKK
ncbi:MAG: bifunctional DNA-binding transcriptional regulator/O6-methylguanine-DNA methyltransferase Ada [Chloracidobacterium sp.]|nr:bifunctional DNA-binding transcriptional regulator/O6-methylguanine-DNA methyltransferase Ada [Chloracidobacterium sp.]